MKVRSGDAGDRRKLNCSLPVIATALAGLLALTGCGSAEDEAGGAGAATAPAGSEDGDAPELVESAVYPGAWATPIELALTPDQDRFEAVAEASALAVEECMSERGFPDYVAKRATLLGRQGYYGVIDADVARVYGFHDPDMLDVETDDPNAPPPPPGGIPLTDELIALVGTDDSRTETVTLSDGTIVESYDPEGCWNIGRLQVQPHVFEMFALQIRLEEMLNSAGFAVQNSPEWLAVYDEFAACVIGKGEADPVFPDGIGGNVPSPPGEISAEEISEAVAHAECKIETGFLRAWSRLRVEAEQALIAHTPGPLTEYIALAEQTYGSGS